MIKKVSIQLNQDLICGGLAIVEREGHEDCIYFDVVKGPAPQVIVGGRGKRRGRGKLRYQDVPITDEEADQFEKALLALFVDHGVPLKIGNYSITA
jgi:hypothetical protein